MNIVGKILVILNLLFALLVGGFLVIDFATRTNWKASYDALKRELEVANVNNKTLQQGMVRLNAEVKDAKTKVEDEMAKLKIERQFLENDKDALNGLLQVEKDRAKDADLNGQKAIAELATVKEEVKLLQGVIKKREDTILTMEDSVKRYRGEAAANEAKYLATLTRNEFLVSRIQELEQKAAKEKAGPATVAVKNVNDLNPPSGYVKGKIEQIDSKDRNLVRVSVGSDHGVGMNNTLEVYRLNPRAEYLGVIRIVDLHPRNAVGQLIRANSAKTPLQEGDIVASSLNNP
jgi:hypothetical protein